MLKTNRRIIRELSLISWDAKIMLMKFFNIRCGTCDQYIWQLSPFANFTFGIYIRFEKHE